MTGSSRRTFLKSSGALVGIAAAATSCAKAEDTLPSETNGEGAMSTQSAERLSDVTFTSDERAQMADTLEGRLETLRQLRSVDKPNDLAPALTFDPRLPGKAYNTDQPDNVSLTPIASRTEPEPQPDDIPFASVAQLGKWLATGDITSRQLTEIYLDRIETHGPKLECFITVLSERALAEADAMDAELAAGQSRGPLHGIPYAVKDLFDATGGKTTWGAAPYQDRPSAGDAAIVRRLKEAGAVLLGKTTCGALAYGDVWFGGTTRNPWNTAEGSSGSSAGSASATAAGLCAFAIGTETLGSLVSPSDRCGVNALRPTFGRVSRAGGMALCWSLDKAGPMTRSVEDLALVMSVINGYDSNDAGSIHTGFHYDSGTDMSGLQLGFDETWLEAASDVEKSAIEAAKSLGARLRPFRLPDLPAGPLIEQLLAEAAAAFEELTLSNRDDEMVWQDDEAWPNTFRAARFISAIDLIQIDRLRRKWMRAMDQAFSGLDVVIGPNFTSGMLTPTNYTGHPCLVMRAGFSEQKTRPMFDDKTPANEETARVPTAISLWAPLFEEGPMLAFGRALEAELGVAGERPPLS